MYHGQYDNPLENQTQNEGYSETILFRKCHTHSVTAEPQGHPQPSHVLQSAHNKLLHFTILALALLPFLACMLLLKKKLKLKLLAHDIFTLLPLL